MMRLPLFDFRAPRTLEEAARILDGEGSNAMLLAGGTDLLPNMKRRQQVPRTLLSLRHVESLNQIRLDPSASRLGACLTLSAIASDPRFRNGLTALTQAASQVATPQIRNMATLGGNLCLDTRCNYYDQSYEWRKAINFCLKKDGDTCWVAPGSSKCMAVSSTDTAPALIALGARVRLVSRSEEREVSLADLYNNDGMNYIRRRPNEILAEVLLDSLHGWKSTYWKLRRRGSFDFPVLSVAASVRLSRSGVVEEARIVIGSTASRPLVVAEAAKFLLNGSLNQDSIAEAAVLAAKTAKPLDNTDFDMSWRKKVTAEFVTYALRELRGDDMRVERESITRYPFGDDFVKIQ
ncbi:MAG TPA: FAD binding domain-containing protein [Candidatus Acidoferrales bacterium]|nr:FAD binding domain-containing protein [Candidatus Acidoferrales bacterium]